MGLLHLNTEKKEQSQIWDTTPSDSYIPSYCLSFDLLFVDFALKSTHLFIFHHGRQLFFSLFSIFVVVKSYLIFIHISACK